MHLYFLFGSSTIFIASCHFFFNQLGNLGAHLDGVVIAELFKSLQVRGGKGDTYSGVWFF